MDGRIGHQSATKAQRLNLDDYAPEVPHRQDANHRGALHPRQQIPHRRTAMQDRGHTTNKVTAIRNTVLLIEMSRNFPHAKLSCYKALLNCEKGRIGL